MTLVGIAGAAHSGKDSVASWLMEHRGFTRIALADPVKDAAAATFGVPRGWFDDPEHKEAPVMPWGISPRVMAQKIGTECARRVFGDDVWITRLEVEMDRRRRYLTMDRIVVPDARFENEANFIRARGGRLLIMYRDGADGEVGVAGHASEKGFRPWPTDIPITNNGTFDELYVKLGALFPQKAAA